MFTFNLQYFFISEMAENLSKALAITAFYLYNTVKVHI